MYKDDRLAFTGSDFLKKFRNQDILGILQTSLLTTVGDTVKMLSIDMKGNLRHEKDHEDKDNFIPLHTDYTTFSSSVGKLEPQFLMSFRSASENNPAVHYTVETNEHGLFEVRFHRLAHLNDQNKFELLREDASRITAKEEAMQFFEQFSSLSHYYNEVNKMSYNVCPAYYKFKIAPFNSLIDELYDLEETADGAAD